MIDYFEKFKNERYHDDNLIYLVKILDKQNLSTILFSELLGINHTDILIDARRKRDFDVFIKYNNIQLLIETKVDSSENEYKDGMQTERIYRKYYDASIDQRFIYLTYGASEYYVKMNASKHVGTGPMSNNFSHVGLDSVIRLLKAVKNKISYDPRLQTWLDWLEFEQFKRSHYRDFLCKITKFYELYKNQLNLTDMPNNRINISIPEILVIHFGAFCKVWNSNIPKVLGHVELYPVGRSGRVNDIVINFRGLWNTNSLLTFNGHVNNGCNTYFEINEDGNLHLKITPDTISTSEHSQIVEFLKKNEATLSCGVNCTVEKYKQWSYVVFEWDIGLMDINANQINCVRKSSDIISNALSVLK